MITDPDEDVKEGFIIDLLDEMGIEYKIVSPEDGKYGGLVNKSTGEWNGMIGMVLDQVLVLESVFRHFL